MSIKVFYSYLKSKFIKLILLKKKKKIVIESTVI